MKTKRRSHSASGRFTRGVKAGSKSSTRRHSRKSASSSRKIGGIAEGFVAKLEDLTPL